MFRKFSLFDSRPPPAKISITPPRRKSSIKCAIINTLQQIPNSPEFTSIGFLSSGITAKAAAKRSKSLDNTNNESVKREIQRTYKNTHKSSTLPPVIRELPQSPEIKSNYYPTFESSARKRLWIRRGPIVRYFLLIIFQILHDAERLL